MEEDGMDYVCTACRYKYEGNHEKMQFKDLPAGWHCSICNAPGDAFIETK